MRLVLAQSLWLDQIATPGTAAIGTPAGGMPTDDRLDQDAKGGRPRQTVLCLLCRRRHACAEPGEARMDRQIQGPVRPGLGQGARGDLRPAEEDGDHPGRRQTDAPAERDSASQRQKKVYAAMMELAAAHLAQADYNIGRVLKAIDDLGQRDNTLMIYIVGDNGGSGEGSLQGACQRCNTSRRN
jgi:hypothetical protein